MDSNIEQCLLKLPDYKRELALEIREVFLSAAKDVTETLKWGQLTFVHGKNNIAFVYSYATVDYVNVGFMKATSLSDPKGLFEGTGDGMRHIKVRSSKDIPKAQLKKWIKESIELGVKPDKTKTAKGKAIKRKF